jgi:hypothetical protein
MEITDSILWKDRLVQGVRGRTEPQSTGHLGRLAKGQAACGPTLERIALFIAARASVFPHLRIAGECWIPRYRIAVSWTNVALTAPRRRFGLFLRLRCERA